MQRATPVFLCLLIASSHAYGQDGRTGYAGFFVTSPLQVSAATDRGFLTDDLSAQERLFYLSLSPAVHRETPLARPLQTADNVLIVRAPRRVSSWSGSSRCVRWSGPG